MQLDAFFDAVFGVFNDASFNVNREERINVVVVIETDDDFLDRKLTADGLEVPRQIESDDQVTTGKRLSIPSLYLCDAALKGFCVLRGIEGRCTQQFGREYVDILHCVGRQFAAARILDRNSDSIANDGIEERSDRLERLRSLQTFNFAAVWLEDDYISGISLDPEFGHKFRPAVLCIQTCHDALFCQRCEPPVRGRARFQSPTFCPSHRVEYINKDRLARFFPRGESAR